MSHTKRVLIFIGAIVAIVIIFISVGMIFGNINKSFGTIIRWIAVLALYGFYNYLFPKKQKEQK